MKSSITTKPEDVGFFKPTPGKTLREQLRDKVLLPGEVIQHMCSIITSGSVPPSHWDTPGNAPTSTRNIYLFSLLDVTLPQSSDAEHKGLVRGICWGPGGRIVPNGRFFFKDNVLDEVVGPHDWSCDDWILIQLKR